MDGKGWSTWGEGVSFGLENGMAVIPYALLKYYRKLNLSGSEAMLLIHLLSFRQVEGIDFPSLEELQVVTGRSISVLAGELQKLMKEGFISIDGDNDELRDIHYERYNFSGLYGKLGAYLATVVQEHEQDKHVGGYATSAPRAASGGGFGAKPPHLLLNLGLKRKAEICSVFSKRNSDVRYLQWSVRRYLVGWIKTGIPRS